MKKLQDKSGASMLLALVFLLLCIVIGTVVLTAASVAAGQIGKTKETQQNYYAVSSAAKLAESDMGKMTFTGAYQMVEVEIYHPAQLNEDGTIKTQAWTEYLTPVYNLAAPVNAITESSLMESINVDFKKLYNSTLPSYTGLTGTVPVMDYALEFTEVENIPSVKGRTVVETTGSDKLLYTITISLWTEDEEQAKYNPMTMTFLPSVTEYSETDVETSGYTTTTTTTYTTKVVWNKPEIKKGGI